MTPQLTRRYPGPGGMFAVSFAIHVVIFILIAKFPLLTQFHQEEAPVTYVDLLALPVASPQSGTPAPSKESVPAPPAPAAPAPKQPEMTAPAAKAKPKAPTPRTQAAKPAPTKAESQAEEAEALRKALGKAENTREAQALEEAMGRMAKGGGRTGMPGAKGTEAGSSYGSYVQSRLKDAFASVMASQSKAPELIATITVGADGRIADYRVDKSSGDPIFDDAVARAVAIVKRNPLPPPPKGRQFRGVFRFKPEGVGVR